MEGKSGDDTSRRLNRCFSELDRKVRDIYRTIYFMSDPDRAHDLVSHLEKEVMPFIEQTRRHVHTAPSSREAK